MEVLPTILDNSIDMVLVDPPYFKVKTDSWDRQWAKASGFLEWLDGVLAEYQRVLKPNGSLYLFASPQMSARVELLVSERFRVLNNIQWAKRTGIQNRSKKEGLRAYFPACERIIFAEQKNAESSAKGEAGYEAACDRLRGFVFEPIRAYLASEKERAGVRDGQIVGWMAANGFPKYTVARHSFTQSQFSLPTESNYIALRRCLNELGGDEYLRKDYEELRKDYEELRKDYEELRRPFSASSDRPFTDTWAYDSVQFYPGKHPCEKPLKMIEDIIEISSRADAVVLDTFMGSGTTGVACVNTGRKFIGIEMDAVYFKKADARISLAGSQLELAV